MGTIISKLKNRGIKIVVHSVFQNVFGYLFYAEFGLWTEVLLKVTLLLLLRNY